MAARSWVAGLGIVATVGAAITGAPARTARSAPTPRGAPQPLAATGYEDQAAADPTGCLAPPGAVSARAAGRLPWPLVLESSCGRFAVFPSGAISPGAVQPGAEPSLGYRIPAGPNAWARVENGHVVFELRGRTVWRSAGAAYEEYHVDSAAIGRDWVAFTDYGAEGNLGRMYLARRDGPERVIGMDEAALTATRWGGLIASRWKDDGDFDIVAMGPDGSILRVVANDVPYGDARPDGTVTYRAGTRFVRTDGLHEKVVASTAGLGRPQNVALTNLEDGRIVVTGSDRLRLLAPNGRIEASGAVAPIPKGGWGYLGVWTPVEPGTRAIVFTATHWSDRNAGGGPGWEGVYRLAPGDTQATLLFGRRLRIAVCAHSVSMSWHGRWLLYSACEGRVVAIDTTGRRRPILLNGMARSIPMPDEEREYGLFGAEWAAFGSPSQMAAVARLH